MSENKRTSAVEYSMTRNEKLKNDIIKENMALVVNVVDKHFNYPNHRDDMISAGTLGLIKAADKFDPAKGKFSTLATQAIRNNVIMYLKRDSHEFGSHLHRRTNIGDEVLTTIPCEKKNLGVFEAVGHVFSKLPAKDVDILKTKFGFKEGKYSYFEQGKALANFKKVMKSEGIKRSDFFA